MYLLPSAIRTYAPVAETPLLKVIQTRDHLSLMSGVTPAGQLATLVRPRALTGLDSVTFLRHLGWYLGGKLLPIWDWASIHRAEEVKIFMASGGADDLHLERFPPYAPDLDPDEGVWNHLKNEELGNLSCADFQHLQVELTLAIRRMRRRPDLIQSFFTQAGLDL